MSPYVTCSIQYDIQGECPNIDAVLPIYNTILKMVWRLMTTVSSMIFIMRMSIVNARTRKEGLYIHGIDVIEMEPVLTWNCNSSKMTSWRPSAFWITTIFTSPQRDCTWVMRNINVIVVVGLNYQLDKQSSCRWFETLLHSCDVHAISFSWCHYMMLSGRIHALVTYLNGTWWNVDSLSMHQ